MPFDENSEPERNDPFNDKHFASQLYAIEAIDVAFSSEAINDAGLCYNCAVASGFYNMAIKHMQLCKEKEHSKEGFLSSLSTLWDFVEKMGDPEEPPSMGPPPNQES